jgi:hypothetical protein
MKSQSTNQLLPEDYKTIFFASLILIYIVVSSILTASDGGDFDVYLEAAQKLWRNENIYTPPFAKGLQYYYSVFFALFLIPFSFTNFITEFLWTLLSWFLLYRCFILIRSYLDFSRIEKKQLTLWLILLFLVSIQFILYNISMVQVTIFLLWSILECLHFTYMRKYIHAGILLGLAINIKIIPVLMLAYLFYRGYFKVVLIAIGTFIFLLLIPFLFIGWDFNIFLIKEWWLIINPNNKEHLFETGIGPHGIVALLPVYLSETQGDMDIKRNFVNWSQSTVEMVILCFRLLLLSLSVLYFRSSIFKKESNRLKTYWEISYFLMLIPLLMPHQQKYAFLFVIPIIAYLLYVFVHLKLKDCNTIDFLFLFIFAVSMLVYSPIHGSDVIGSYLFLLSQHFRLLTISTLLVIPVSLYFNPMWFNNKITQV